MALYSVKGGAAGGANTDTGGGAVSAANLTPKSVKWVQEQVTEVVDWDTTLHPDLLHRPPTVSYHRQVGVGARGGHLYVTMVPPLPGPHMKVRAPREAPQSA